jgi:hypothetical protein
MVTLSTLSTVFYIGKHNPLFEKQLSVFYPIESFAKTVALEVRSAEKKPFQLFGYSCSNLMILTKTSPSLNSNEIAILVTSTEVNTFNQAERIELLSKNTDTLFFISKNVYNEYINISRDNLIKKERNLFALEIIKPGLLGLLLGIIFFSIIYITPLVKKD